MSLARDDADSCLTEEEAEDEEKKEKSSIPTLSLSAENSPSASYSATNNSSTSSSSQLCAANCCSPRSHDNNNLPLVTICTAQHRMHVSCAKLWLSTAGNNVSCPLCRDNAIFATLAALKDEKERESRLKREDEERRRSRTFWARIKRHSYVDCWLSLLLYFFGIAIICVGSYVMATNFQEARECFYDGSVNCPHTGTSCSKNLTGCEYDDAKLLFLYKINETVIRGSLQYSFDLCAERCCTTSLIYNEKLFCRTDSSVQTKVIEFFRASSTPQFISGVATIILGIAMIVSVIVYLLVRYGACNRQRAVND